MPTRQSSPKASSIAGRVQRAIREDVRRRKALDLPSEPTSAGPFISVAELKTLCASVLAQDETKGQATKKRKAKAAR